MRRLWTGLLVAAAVTVLLAAPARLLTTRTVAADAAGASQPVAAGRAGAQLDASCFGDGCQGKMAAAAGCRDDRVQVGGFTRPASSDGNEAELNITLWHSPACNSAWAEVDLGTYNNNNDFVRFSWIDQYGGSSHHFDDEIIADAGNYPTPMVSWHNSVQICLDTNVRCTGWR